MSESRFEILARRLRDGDLRVRLQSTDKVPSKRKSKPKPYKMQNTFEKSLRSVPGGVYSRNRTIGLAKMVEAKTTGTRVVDKAPGTMRSCRNANTTSGSYVSTVLRDQTGDVISNAQGRRL